MDSKLELAVNAGYRAYDKEERHADALMKYSVEEISKRALTEAKLAYCRYMMK